jgi:RNA polymerase sigma-70 factor (ECF subfamily)
LLSRYLDADLPPELCSEVESHVSGCAPCVEFIDSLKRTIALCREYEARETPGSLPATARDELLAAYHKMLRRRDR